MSYKDDDARRFGDEGDGDLLEGEAEALGESDEEETLDQEGDKEDEYE